MIARLPVCHGQQPADADEGDARDAVEPAAEAAFAEPGRELRCRSGDHQFVDELDADKSGCQDDELQQLRAFGIDELWQKRCKEDDALGIGCRRHEALGEQLAPPGQRLIGVHTDRQGR